MRVWLLIDGLAGNKAQVLGVAEALERQSEGQFQFEEKALEYGWRAVLPNVLSGVGFMGLTATARQSLTEPWPDMVIAAGRRTAPVALGIKAKSSTTRLVQLMFPGGRRVDDFDLIAVPAHDNLSDRPNTLTVSGAAHRVTPARLAEEADEWRDRLSHLPGPRIALIVGGATKRKNFEPEMAHELARRANRMAEAAGGSLMITTSRRTPDAATDAILAEITVPNFLYRWGDGGANPYFAYLGLADAVVVTGDSVSMCSEACAAPAPVYIYAPAGYCVLKHRRLHADLFQKGFARSLESEAVLDNAPHPPLNAAEDIAEAILQRWG